MSGVLPSPHGNRFSRWLRWPHLMYSKTARCHYIERCDCDLYKR